MINAVELQVINRILSSDNQEEIDTLCSFDKSYYKLFPAQIEFILKHKDQYGTVPDKFTFQMTFPDFTYIQVKEPLDFLTKELVKNKRHTILLDMFNKIKELGADDVDDAWTYIDTQCERIHELDTSEPLDLVHDAEKRCKQVQEYSKQRRIPTGFKEIDQAMYGGLSTVEELVIGVARSGTGKSWFATRVMESAQSNGFNVVYYSPEMQASFLGTRFDTWRGNFANSQLHQGIYSEEYKAYIQELKNQEACAYVIEDKDVPEGNVNVPFIDRFVQKHNIKLVIIDGLSYMDDVKAKYNDTDTVRFRNLCADLFRMSKRRGCAVFVMMQANRATKDTKDDKGEPFPNIYNIEGSDHPARIATQVFALRQIFEKHILDIRMEKARSANNQKPAFSYSWDINTGSMQYILNSDTIPDADVPSVNLDVETVSMTPDIDNLGLDMSLGDEDVDF